MPTREEERAINTLVSFYKMEDNQSLLSIVKEQVLVALRESGPLKEYVHSFKARLKDPEKLRNKLYRKLAESKTKGSAFGITQGNLFVEISDLIGIRILHLHTRQFESIDPALRQIFREHKYKLVEKPFARTWDDEYRGFFRQLGLKVEASPTMYTSVHYVIEPVSRTRARCEIQVRTLMEEVWGEVDHTFNYPEPIKSVACREQIKALARATSSATRLVDSIFATVADLKLARAASSKSTHNRRSTPSRKK